jgi:hypothetical protein
MRTNSKSKTIFYALLIDALIVFSRGMHACPNCDYSLNFLLGASLLGITSILFFVNEKIFEISFFILLVGSTFYFEFDPYTVSYASFTLNSTTIFCGKPFPVVFFLAYIFLHRQEIRKFLSRDKSQD